MIQRLYSFTSGTLIQSSQVNAELTQLINLLAGTKVDEPVSFVHNGAANPTLSVNNTGGGKPFAAQVLGNTVVEINNSGQIKSFLSTGTAPLVVGSTTLVANLNADLIDGQHLSGLLLATNPIVNDSSGTARIDLNPTSAVLRLQNSATQFIIRNESGAADLVVFTKATKAAAFQGQVSSAIAAPSAAADLTRKDYVDGRKTRWVYQAFWHGQISTSTLQPAFVVPPGVSLFTLSSFNAVYRSGSPTGTTTLRLFHYNGSGVLQGQYDVSLTAGQAARVPVSVSVGPVTLSAGHQLEIVAVTAGGHWNVTAAAQGTQSVAS